MPEPTPPLNGPSDPSPGNPATVGGASGSPNSPSAPIPVRASRPPLLGKLRRFFLRPDPVPDILSALQDWTPSGPLDQYLSLSERSLKSVIDLTSYEDEKASRLLAGVAFLGALAGALITLITRDSPGLLVRVDNAVLALLDRHASTADTLLASWGVAFLLYALLLLAGVYLVLTAIQPRFNIPRGWSENSTASGRPKSYMFFEHIVSAGPRGWVLGFRNLSPSELQLEYVKNSILESFLVAQKIGTKLRPLKLGVQCLRLSLLCLFAWVALTGPLLLLPSPAQEAAFPAPVHRPLHLASAPPVLQAPSASRRPATGPPQPDVSAKPRTSRPKVR